MILQARLNGLRTGGVILLLIALALCAGRYGLQRWTAARMALSTAGAIDERAFVEINGRAQWLSIRGRSDNNPILLVVHGGPGQALSPFTSTFREWEGSFTVVQWDQQGAGKTFTRAGARLPVDLTLGRLALDGVEVAGLLKRRLPGRPIIVLGVSSGTVIALDMVRRRPDIFSAYVGAGQVVSVPAQEARAYQRLMAKAIEHGDDHAVQSLRATGPPPYSRLAGLMAERAVASRFERPRLPTRALAAQLLAAPDYSLTDVVGHQLAVRSSSRHFLGNRMDGSWMAVDVGKFGSRYGPPLLLLQGSEDDITPTELGAAWLASVDAPARVLCIIPGAGHNAIITRNDAALRILKSQMPLLAQGQRPAASDGDCRSLDAPAVVSAAPLIPSRLVATFGPGK